MQTAAALQRQIKSAVGLSSVVRTMKMLAAVSIAPYEKAVAALAAYQANIDRGLRVCLAAADGATLATLTQPRPGPRAAILFGSDQGMVGGFNDQLLAYATPWLQEPATRWFVWPVGARIRDRLTDVGMATETLFPTPDAVDAIPALIGDLLAAIEAERTAAGITTIALFYHEPSPRTGFAPTHTVLLPIDGGWLNAICTQDWSSRQQPEAVGGDTVLLPALLHEYLFAALFRACARSCAAEHSTRLAAMQRAEKKIDELLTDLHRQFHHERQTAIMAELFDVIAGFESLAARSAMARSGTARGTATGGTPRAV